MTPFESSTPAVAQPSLLNRIRFQLAAGLFFACLMPMLLRYDILFAEKLTSASQYNTLVATVCAVLIGYYGLRRLNHYPGITNISYILPSFTFSYSLVLVVILFFRADYSRFFLLFSFISAQICFHVIWYVSSRVGKPSFAVVPVGNTTRLCRIKDVHWKVLERPRLNGFPIQGLAVDLRADLSPQWQAFIADVAVRGVPVYHYKQLSESLTGKVEIEHLSENNLGSLLPSFIYLHFKKSLDILGALLLLPLLLPLFAVIAVLIRRDSPGPVFFRQPRMGFQGHVFEVWKFRTMEHVQKTTVSELEAAKTSNGDPRVTKIGRFLRKTRLDELPQVFNVLRGEMSWIGPRPEALPLSKWYEKEIPFYRYRHIVRPGITGWAQVNQGHVAEMGEVQTKLHFDFYYIKNFSIWLDILITMRTIAIIYTGFGAR